MKNVPQILSLLKQCALIGVAATLAGCGTIHGVDQDIEHVGDRIQEEFQ